MNIFSCVPAISSIIPDIGAREGGRHRRNIVETFFFLDPSLPFSFFLFLFFFSYPASPTRGNGSSPQRRPTFPITLNRGGWIGKGRGALFLARPHSLVIQRTWLCPPLSLTPQARVIHLLSLRRAFTPKCRDFSVRRLSKRTFRSATNRKTHAHIKAN